MPCHAMIGYHSNSWASCCSSYSKQQFISWSYSCVVLYFVTDGCDGNRERFGPGILQSERYTGSPAGPTSTTGVQYGTFSGRSFRHVVLLRLQGVQWWTTSDCLQGQPSSYQQSAQSHGDHLQSCWQWSGQPAVWRQYGELRWTTHWWYVCIMSADHCFPQQICLNSKWCGPVCQILQLTTAANFPHVQW